VSLILYILILFKQLHFKAGVPSRWGLWERVALHSRHSVAKIFSAGVFCLETLRETAFFFSDRVESGWRIEWRVCLGAPTKQKIKLHRYW
jgi:hypothetical protein